MLNKLFLSFLPVILFFITISAQSQNLDIIYLKNGSIIKGEIMKMSQDKKITVQTTDNKTWTFAIDEIEEIKKDSTTIKYNLVPQKNAGYINYSSMGLLIGSKNTNHNAPFSITMVNGYIFKNNLSIGGGLGLEFFENANIPVFADVRYILGSKTLSPFAYAQGGYVFPLDNETNVYYQEYKNRGGYMFNSGIGLLINFNSGNGLIFNFAYRHQVSKVDYNDAFERELRQYYNRFNIRFGWVFR